MDSLEKRRSAVARGEISSRHPMEDPDDALPLYRGAADFDPDVRSVERGRREKHEKLVRPVKRGLDLLVEIITCLDPVRVEEEAGPCCLHLFRDLSRDP